MTAINKKPRKPSLRAIVRPFLQLPGMINIVIKRQKYYPVLAGLAVTNIILAVSLLTSASFFSQAVDRVVLLDELKKFTSVTKRPPFSTSIYIFPSARMPITLENAELLSQHIGSTLSSEVGLPLRHSGIEVNSGYQILQPSPDSTLFAQGQQNLATVEVMYIANISPQMQIVEGVPLDEKAESKDQVDVWIYDSLAQETGIHVGEKMMLGRNMSGEKVPIRVAGIWHAANPGADFWFSNPDSEYKNTLLVRRSDYIHSIQPTIAGGSGQVSWYIILDENRLVPKQSQQYLAGFRRANELINKFLPGARMNMPPLDPLDRFVQRSSAMTVLLMGYNLPAFAILLYFLVLTSAIMAQWQRRETVIMVGRGMSLSGILSLVITEQVILFIISYPVGLGLGMLLARWMGYTASFLSFTDRAPLPISLEGFNLPLTALALSFALFSRLVPVLRAAHSSLVNEERERARPMRKPFWYRFYLDLVLIIPTWYAYDQMIKRGSLAGLVTSKPEDLYRDPLLIVVPALFILTTSFVAMRIFTALSRLIDLIAGVIPWLALHLALRQLGRQSLEYIRPLLLVIIALAMGVYTLAMAASLDQWTVDRMYYRNGVDFAFTPQPGPDSAIPDDGNWIPLPQDFAQVRGVAAATRVKEFDMHLNPDTSSDIRGHFLGIDRAEFASVAWFRSDFARESLGAMMNRLAVNPEGILVSEDLMKERGYRIGEIVTIRVDVERIMSTVSEYVIVGTYQYFPTVYADTPTVIGNLDYIANLTGVTPAHDIWLRLQHGADTAALQRDIQNTLHVQTGKVRDTGALVREEEGRLERIGIFGTLTISFLATALMAILGLLVYSYASLQDRAYRLVVLNAVGLSRRQILTQVILEYTFLALFGVLAGALIGSAAANLFIPFFRYTGGKEIPLPPLLPVLSGTPLRNLSLFFGLTIISVEIVSMTAILRNRLVQIMKRVWM